MGHSKVLGPPVVVILVVVEERVVSVTSVGPLVVVVVGHVVEVVELGAEP